MNQELKKRLARNWFKILQEVICKEIEIIESRKKIFKKKNGLEGIKKKKVEESSEYLKMEKFSKRWV